MLSATCLKKYRRVRQQTEELCQPLAIDDYQLQTMPDCSPPKWHLAHTTWFFETFLLSGNNPSYRPFHPRYNFLFNSYYEAVGPPGCGKSAISVPVSRSTMKVPPTASSYHRFRSRRTWLPTGNFSRSSTTAAT